MFAIAAAIRDNESLSSKTRGTQKLGAKFGYARFLYVMRSHILNTPRADDIAYRTDGAVAYTLSSTAGRWSLLDCFLSLRREQVKFQGSTKKTFTHTYPFHYSVSLTRGGREIDFNPRPQTP